MPSSASGARPSPVACVQVMQALIARELVEGLGLPERRAAALLGVVPSAVSQYLSGKRLAPTLSAYLGDKTARHLARAAAHQLTEGGGDPSVVLSAATAFGDRFAERGSGERPGRPTVIPEEVQRKIPGWLRNRIAGEQSAVAECMRLAQRSRDELTRALFRQIASDSLRHAEIVASLAAYLDRGTSSVRPSGITREDVQALIAQEHAAEASSDVDLGPQLGGMMRILWDSMESDEKKHERLLEELLELVGPSDGRRARRKAAAPATEGKPTVPSKIM